MATSRPVSDHVSCLVCMEQYNRTDHIPKLLPCQHTLCLACLLAMEQNSFSMPVECPTCRSRHEGSPHDFTTNRVAMDIAEELQQASPSLSCSTHTDMDSVLVCVDCLTGLCVKCMKKLSGGSHKGHQLEELNDAKTLLRERFVNETRKQQSTLKIEMASAVSVAEITRAEDDIKQLCTLLISVITEWQNDQLSIIGEIKTKAVNREQAINAHHANLEAMLQSDIDISTLIRNLTQKEQIGGQTLRGNTYNFVTARETILADLTSVITSENFVNSKFLQKQTSDATSRVASPIQRPQQKPARQTLVPPSPARRDFQGREVSRYMEQEQEDPAYIRKYHGPRGILQAMLNEDLRVPSHWTKNTGSWSKWLTKHMPSLSNVLVDVDAKTCAAIDQLVTGSWVQKFVGYGADSVGLSHSNIQVRKVQRIENPSTYRHYRNGRNFACEEGLKCDFRAITSINNVPEVLTATLNIPELERIRTREVNEYFLFYGTRKDVMENIVVQGPDSRFSRKGLFGSGLYLFESSTKADQYADEKDARVPAGTPLYMVICRVILGHIYQRKGSAKYKCPPCRHKGCHRDDCSHHERFDSVMGTEKDGGVRLNFREFVLFDNQHVYPELLVTYTRK